MKDKRTKEQILQLLDHAMEQEEKHAQKIQALENQLAECQKRADDPRYELTDEAIAASKVSFRLNPASYPPSLTSPARQPEPVAPATPSVESPDHQQPQMHTAPVSLGQLSQRVRSLLSDMVVHEEVVEPALSDAATPRQAIKLTAPACSVIAGGEPQHQGVLQAGQHFQVEISMEELGAFCGEPCRAALLIKNLESGHDHRLSEACIPGSRALRLPRQPIQLTTGAYRFTAVLSLDADPRKVYYKESRLLVVQ